jgi:hypothetical protein
MLFKYYEIASTIQIIRLTFCFAYQHGCCLYVFAFSDPQQLCDYSSFRSTQMSRCRITYTRFSQVDEQNVDHFVEAWQVLRLHQGGVP